MNFDLDTGAMCTEEIVVSLWIVIDYALVSLVTMDSEKHTEFLNYFLNKHKKYPARMYNLSPKNRDNQKANFRRLMKPFNVKNGTLYHGDVEAVTREDDAIPPTVPWPKCPNTSHM